MRLIIVVVLLGVVAVMALRGRKAPFALMGVFALIATMLGAMEAQWLMRENTYTAITRKLTERDDVKVHCQRTLANLVDISGNLGYVPYPPDGSKPTDTYFRKDTCEHLDAYISSAKTDPSMEQIRAVHVLTHEAMHLAGHFNEAEAECAAIQRNYVTAVALGATDYHAEKLAAAYFKDIHPKMLSQYLSPECNRGGALDEQLPHAPWAKK